MAELLRALGDAAAARRREILDAARAEAERIAGEAAAREAASAAACRAQVVAEARAAAEARLAAARREAAGRLILARSGSTERVLAAAVARLADLLASDPDLVDRLVVQALAYLDRPAIARCSPASADAVRAALARATAIDVEVIADPAARAGVELAARDGSLVIDATLEGILERARGEIEIDLVRRIEGEAP